MLVPLALIHSSPKLFQGKRVNFYIDNDAAANALIRAYCSEPALAAMIRAFEEKDASLSLGVWIGTVGYSVNPADLPTRNKNLAFPILKRVQFNSLFWSMCTTSRDAAR